jgi:hypothetical protein
MQLMVRKICTFVQNSAYVSTGGLFCVLFCDMLDTPMQMFSCLRTTAQIVLFLYFLSMVISHCGLGCDTVSTCGWMPTFLRARLPPSSWPALNTEAACSSDKLVSIYKTTPCHSPEDGNLNNHHRENLRTYRDLI